MELKPRSNRRNRIWLYFVLAAVLTAAVFYGVLFSPRLQTGLMSAFQPFFSGMNSAAKKIYASRDFFSSRRSLSAEIERLESEKSVLEAKINELAMLRRENAELKDIFQVKENYSLFTLIPARSIGFFRDGRDEFIFISSGTRNGVHSDLAVIDSRNVLVGRVSESYDYFSKVKLVTSFSETMEVVMASSGIKVLVKGNNFREFAVDLVPQGVKVEESENILFVGSARYPWLTAVVGRVAEISDSENGIFKKIKAIHPFNPQAFEEVVVVKTEN